MLENYDKIEKITKIRKIGRKNKVYQRVYFVTWLGFLGVACEGFRKLNVRTILSTRPPIFVEAIPLADGIGKLIKKNADSLRIFRNNVFHLRESPDEMLQFIKGGSNRIEWARDLHQALSNFFKEYRVNCEIEYIENGRISESNIAGGNK